MTKKQYMDMTTIMQFGRIFSEQIDKCLLHTGLKEQGYEFRINISEVDGRNFINVVLEQNALTMPIGEYEKNRMSQYKISNDDWRVNHDPITEAGTIPATIRAEEIRTAYAEAERKTGTKPYPPDGLWVNSRDNYCDVDGGQ